MTQMIENNYFKIGEIFYHKNGQQATLISKKGILEYNGEQNSMHEIAAKMMNKVHRVNAFDWLYVLRNNKLISINEVRNEYRKNL